MQILLTNKLEANLNRIRDQKCKFSRSLLFFRLVPDARPMMIAYDTIFFILFIFTFLHSDSLLFREKLRLLQEVQLCAAAVNYMTQYANLLNVKVFKFLAAKVLDTCADTSLVVHDITHFISVSMWISNEAAAISLFISE